jgi:hypothetical protein
VVAMNPVSSCYFCNELLAFGFQPKTVRPL